MKGQKERLLNLLQERGERGVKVYELIAPRPQGEGIAQYNARIKELRELGYNVVNKKPGLFVLSGAEKNVEKQPIRAEKLDGEIKQTWEQVGAFLKGRAEKPNTKDKFVEAIRSELF